MLTCWSFQMEAHLAFLLGPVRTSEPPPSPRQSEACTGQPLRSLQVPVLSRGPRAPRHPGSEAWSSQWISVFIYAGSLSSEICKPHESQMMTLLSWCYRTTLHWLSSHKWRTFLAVWGLGFFFPFKLLSFGRRRITSAKIAHKKNSSQEATA